MNITKAWSGQLKIFNAEPGTLEGDELDILLPLVLAYEDIHFHIPEPDTTDS